MTSAAFGVPALVSGEVDYMVTAVGGLTGLIKEGKVKGLAVTSPKRSELLPDVPTTAEAGLPAMSYVNWYAVIGPAGIPGAITERLNKAFKNAMKDPAVQDRMKTIGLVVSDKTVRNVLTRIFEKLRVKSRTQAIVAARDHGFH